MNGKLECKIWALKESGAVWGGDKIKLSAVCLKE